MGIENVDCQPVAPLRDIGLTTPDDVTYWVGAISNDIDVPPDSGGIYEGAHRIEAAALPT